jgi:hypothetical protein
MMYAKFCDMTLYIIFVEYGTNRIYYLKHSIAKPSLYPAIDLGVKMLNALGASYVHVLLSLLGTGGYPMHPGD